MIKKYAFFAILLINSNLFSMDQTLPETINIQNPEENCAICRDAIGNNVINISQPYRCNHQFHVGCVSQWIKRNGYNATCPLCRAVNLFADNGLFFLGHYSVEDLLADGSNNNQS